MTFIGIVILVTLLSMLSTIFATDIGCVSLEEDGVTSEHCFTAYTEDLEQPQANDKCSSLAARLARITSSEINTFIESSLKEKLLIGSNNYYWIGAEMELLPTWEWINGEQYDADSYGDVADYNSNCPGTAFLDVLSVSPDWNIDISSHCSVNKRIISKYICEFRGTACVNKSPITGHTHICFDIRSDALITWYRARNHCLSRGGDLLTSLDSFYAQLNDSTMQVMINQQFWIGLRKAIWKWTSVGSASSSVNVSFTNWNLRSPYSPTNPCVSVGGESFEWNSLRCSSFSHYICEYIRQVDMTLPKQSLPSYVIGAVSSVVGTLVAVAIAAVICRLRRGKRRSNTRTQTSTSNAPENGVDNYEELSPKNPYKSEYTDLRIVPLETVPGYHQVTSSLAPYIELLPSPVIPSQNVSLNVQSPTSVRTSNNLDNTYEYIDD